MKRIKSKVAVGAIVVGMVASMGTAFAATDAGSQLQSWYSTASTAVKATVSGDFASYYSTQKTAHAATVNGIKTGAQEDIRDAGNAKTSSVQQSINGQVTQYTNQINSAQGAIASSMPGEYDAFVSTTNGTTNTGVAAIGTEDKKTLNNAIKNHKNTYLNRLDTNVTATKTQAVNTLNAKIASTKSELQALLAGEQTDATAEVKANLDSKLAALEAELTTLTEAGVSEAKTAIDTKGDQLLNDSLNDLDAIVQGIQ
ncbi:hypothetical protein [Cohnella sp. GCM10012308]|uniref:hypothetical protein n=1 Tax=Cohnella sp. GCM10012308 TaxID=3317329 RepID=UPI0036138888